MTPHDGNANECERYTELAAMATADTLMGGELADLRLHLRECGDCRSIYHQYQVLAREGFPSLACRYEHLEASGNWDDTAARRKLFARISEIREEAATTEAAHPHSNVRARLPRRGPRRTELSAALVACLLLGTGIATWRLLSSGETRAKLAEFSARSRIEEALSAKKSAEALLAAQSERIALLQTEDYTEHRETERLRTQLRALQRQWADERSSTQRGLNTLATGEAAADEKVRMMSLQRDRLSAQLHDALQAWQNIQTELASLRADRNKALLDRAELEARVSELTAANRDQERRLANSDQYLSSDRDIRELMGARSLYIADVFDVDSSSRTRKPYGRVFYTQGKSLIFYAFDLDRQPRVKNTSAFQVWGQKETPQNERSRVLNLGVLYLDSESNRRWILRSDDPRTLAEIDAVFVTVEPHGGSAKPTGRPFLFAMLRKEANHP